MSYGLLSDTCLFSLLSSCSVSYISHFVCLIEMFSSLLTNATIKESFGSCRPMSFCSTASSYISCHVYNVILLNNFERYCCFLQDKGLGEVRHILKLWKTSTKLKSKQNNYVILFKLVNFICLCICITSYYCISNCALISFG